MARGACVDEPALIRALRSEAIKGAALSQVLSKTLNEQGIDAAIAQYRDLKSRGFENLYASQKGTMQGTSVVAGILPEFVPDGPRGLVEVRAGEAIPPGVLTGRAGAPVELDARLVEDATAVNGIVQDRKSTRLNSSH